MLTQAYFNLSSLLPLAAADLEADNLAQAYAPGSFGIYVDAYGPRFLQYIKNADSIALTLGMFVARAADVTKSAVTSGTTSSVTTSGLTADAHVGKVLIDETAAVAGAAPEGESGIIVSNSTTLIKIDPAYPFSVAPGADNVRIRSVFHGIANASATVKSRDVLGAVVAANGISVGNFGWVQFGGVHPLAKNLTNAAITNGAAVIGTTTAGAANVSSSSGVDILLGRALCTIASTNAGKNPMDIRCNIFGTFVTT